MAKNPAIEGIEHRQKVMEEQNAEFYRREAEAKPTPTQRENDLAKVNALDIDDKEDDGSEPDEAVAKRVMEARLPGNNPYDTRDVAAPAPRRGRPAKSE